MEHSVIDIISDKTAAPAPVKILRIASALTLIITGAVPLCHGETLRPDNSQLEIINKAVDYAFSDSFAAAYNTAKSLEDSPAPPPLYNLLTASILHAEMTDAEEFFAKKRFFDLIESSIDFLDDWKKRNPDDPWGYFFTGTAYAYKSLWHGQHKSWIKSFIDGLKARSNFSRAIEIDPRLYDAYTGIGNYHYWSAAKLSKYIPLLPDNREKGLEELRIAMDSSMFSSKAAATGLAWALINQKKLHEAADIGLSLYNETSGGRASLWILGGAYWRTGDMIKAERYYGELIESLIKIGEQNYYNLIFCRYRRGVCLYRLRLLERAENEFNTLVSYPASGKIRDRHKKTYKKTGEYLEKIRKAGGRDSGG